MGIAGSPCGNALHIGQVIIDFPLAHHAKPVLDIAFHELICHAVAHVGATGKIRHIGEGFYRGFRVGLCPFGKQNIGKRVSIWQCSGRLFGEEKLRVKSHEHVLGVELRPSRGKHPRRSIVTTGSAEDAWHFLSCCFLRCCHEEQPSFRSHLGFHGKRKRFVCGRILGGNGGVLCQGLRLFTATVRCAMIARDKAGAECNRSGDPRSERLAAHHGKNRFSSPGRYESRSFWISSGRRFELLSISSADSAFFFFNPR